MDELDRRKLDAFELFGSCVSTGDILTSPCEHADMESLKQVRNRRGRCYELTWRAMLEEEGSEAFVLVHGTLAASLLGLWDAYGHAWIELPDGRVYDPTLNEYAPKAEYYDWYKPSDCQRYSRTQAMELAAHVGHYGPWTEEEMAEIAAKAA